MKFDPDIIGVSRTEATVLWPKTGTMLSYRCYEGVVPTPQNLKQVGGPMSQSSAAGQSVIVSKGMVEASRRVAAHAIERYRADHEKPVRRLSPHQLSLTFH